MNPHAINDALAENAIATGLRALTATLDDARRAERFLALTGLDAPELRARAADPVLLAALIDFLESHEPDLVAVAEAIGATPAALVAIRAPLEAATR